MKPCYSIAVKYATITLIVYCNLHVVHSTTHQGNTRLYLLHETNNVSKPHNMPRKNGSNHKKMSDRQLKLPTHWKWYYLDCTTVHKTIITNCTKSISNQNHKATPPTMQHLHNNHSWRQRKDNEVLNNTTSQTNIINYSIMKSTVWCSVDKLAFWQRISYFDNNWYFPVDRLHCGPNLII